MDNNGWNIYKLSCQSEINHLKKKSKYRGRLLLSWYLQLWKLVWFLMACQPVWAYFILRVKGIANIVYIYHFVFVSLDTVISSIPIAYSFQIDLWPRSCTLTGTTTIDEWYGSNGNKGILKTLLSQVFRCNLVTYPGPPTSTTSFFFFFFFFFFF